MTLNKALKYQLPLSCGEYYHCRRTKLNGHESIFGYCKALHYSIVLLFTSHFHFVLSLYTSSIWNRYALFFFHFEFIYFENSKSFINNCISRRSFKSLYITFNISRADLLKDNLLRGYQMGKGQVQQIKAQNI